jgi:hypothetical protein
VLIDMTGSGTNVLVTTEVTGGGTDLRLRRGDYAD